MGRVKSELYIGYRESARKVSDRSTAARSRWSSRIYEQSVTLDDCCCSLRVLHTDLSVYCLALPCIVSKYEALSASG